MRFQRKRNIDWHRIVTMMILCFFGLSLAYSVKPRRTRARVKKVDNRIYLEHADQLEYDMYGPRKGMMESPQMVRGKVSFRHNGGRLTCDSAYFFQESNAFEAFGHVKYRSGDTLTLTSDHAWYDGEQEMMEARHNVVLTHRKSKLYCDSLNYDQMYGIAYFFEGGKLIDKGNTLTSDWGQYNTENREAVFYYKVKLRNKKFTMTSDTLYYDTRSAMSHVVGPSVIESDNSIVHTNDGYYNSNTERSELYGRSTVVNGAKTITADSLYTNNKTNTNEGFGNVVYEDTENKSRFLGNHIYYEENTGYGYATDSAVAIDYSQKDTLYVHGDSIKIYTYNINTDSVYRNIHAFHHVRAFRVDVQAVCDSLVYTSQDSCMTMYKDPIVWNMGRQVLGNVIHAYIADSTIHYADVIGQALSVEKVDSVHFNQVSSKEMRAYFEEGKPRQTWAIGNVLTVYYPVDDADTTLIGLNYLETDTMKMYLSPERQLERIWASKSKGTMYPLTQIPHDKLYLPNYAWFENIRPMDKDDIFVWRGKGEEKILKEEKRREAPVINLTKKEGIVKQEEKESLVD